MANEKRLIDASELIKEIIFTKNCLANEGACEWTKGFRSGLVAVLEHIENTPTAAVADYLLDNDVVPVVRCKDCYYFTEHNDVRSGRHLGYGECHRLRGELFKDTDFCSYGERKDNV